MEGRADFLPSTWQEGGTLTAIEAEADEKGRLVPKYRVINPGWNDRKGTGYMYLIIYGIVEEKDQADKKNRGMKSFAAFPLGVGRSLSSPQELLDACLALDITVRRTAGAGEKLVMGTSNISPALSPWSTILSKGAIFSAIKVCNNVDVIMVDRPQKLRPIFLTITMLTDAGVYKIPRTVLDFRATNAISFNLLVELNIGADFTSSGTKGMINDAGERVTTFMVHIGNFVRKKGKIYSVDYCRQKVDRMDLRFSLGAVGGLSLHVKVAGKVSKTLRAQLGHKSVICYSLMDTNPYLNRVMWKAECSINKVTAVFQPSVPKEFRIYEDVLIDHTGKILAQ
ncbi:matrix protein [Wufeng Typhlomys cinereus jeilongvirus 1]|uniref:Matrix protein n=1 Tax=Wufeng Typhlomys cinereus jeilongvirus 1 TaxID=2928989 RepID=A0A8T9KLE7_9MONO|nr:matrix protein [Wufeng Typhlomys cinereus jeilongvirus 1]